MAPCPSELKSAPTVASTVASQTDQIGGAMRQQAQPVSTLNRRGLFGLYKSVYATAGLSIFWGLLLTVVLLFVLSFSKEDGRLRKLTRDGEDFVASAIRDRIEFGLSLGLNLKAAANNEAIIRSALEGDKDILRIVLFDHSGKVVLSSGEAAEAVDANVPDAWKYSAGLATGKVDDERQRNAGVVVTSLVNAYGKAVGGLAIVFSQARLAADEDALWGEMIGASYRVLAGVAVLSVFVVGAVFRATARSLGRAAAALETDGDTAPAAEFPNADVKVEIEVDRLRKRLSEGWRSLGEAGRRLEGFGR